MTFFSNPNSGMYPPDYGRGSRSPYMPGQNFTRSPEVFTARQQQAYIRPMSPNQAWEQDYHAYNLQQPFNNPYNGQPQAFNMNIAPQQPYIAPPPNNRRQQRQQPKDLMEGVNALMGHAGTIKEGLNMMNQFVSLINSLKL